MIRTLKVAGLTCAALGLALAAFSAPTSASVARPSGNSEPASYSGSDESNCDPSPDDPNVCELVGTADDGGGSAKLDSPADAVPAVYDGPDLSNCEASESDGDTCGVSMTATLDPTTDGPALPCTFVTDGDYVHMSSTPGDVSGHGWWTTRTCPPEWQAWVLVDLQEYWSDGSWRPEGDEGVAILRPKNYGGGVSNGRGHCDTRGMAAWRSIIDVDIIGHADSPDKAITVYHNLPCRIY